MRRFLLAGLLTLLIATFLACGSSSNVGTLASSSSSPSSPSSTSQHFAVGQQVTIGQTWQITVENIQTSAGSSIFTPKAGNVFLLVTVAVKNISSSEQTMSSLVQWSLSDTSGQRYTETIDPDAGAGLDGKVESGSPLKGVLVYEVPTGTKAFQLAFESDVISSGETIWDVKI